MAEIFISYSERDKQIADRLADALTKAGRQVYRGVEILPGVPISEGVEQEIGRAKWVLVILSNHSMESKWVRLELGAALAAEAEGRTRVVPVVVGDVEPPSILRDRVYADLRSDFDRGVATLLRGLDEKRRPSKLSREREKRTVSGVLGVLVSLLGAATSTLSFSFGAWSAKSSELVVGIVAAVGLSVLVAMFTRVAQLRRPHPLRAFASSVQQAYLSAIDTSALNPSRVLEVRNARL